MDLARRVVGEVFATHDVRDILVGIVDDHRELVGPQAVGASQHEIADIARDVLGLRAEPTVVPADGDGRGVAAHAQAPGAGGPAVQPRAAGAGVDELLVAPMRPPRRCQRALDVATRAAARIGVARGDQTRERCLIVRASLGLPHRRIVGNQAQRLELPQDFTIGARHAAGRVDILDADEPARAMRARVEPARQRRDERARVQRASGRRGEAADVRRHQAVRSTEPAWRSTRALRVVSLAS